MVTHAIILYMLLHECVLQTSHILDFMYIFKFASATIVQYVSNLNMCQKLQAKSLWMVVDFPIPWIKSITHTVVQHLIYNRNVHI